MSRNIDKDIEKKINKRLAELYKDQTFRLKLEREAAKLKTPQDFQNYINQAEKKSRKEAKNESKK